MNFRPQKTHKVINKAVCLSFLSHTFLEAPGGSFQCKVAYGEEQRRKKSDVQMCWS